MTNPTECLRRRLNRGRSFGLTLIFPILFLRLLLSFGFDWKDVSSTRDSVSSHFQTPRKYFAARRIFNSPTRRIRNYFKMVAIFKNEKILGTRLNSLLDRCLKMWCNVRYITWNCKSSPRELMNGSRIIRRGGIQGHNLFKLRVNLADGHGKRQENRKKQQQELAHILAHLHQWQLQRTNITIHL